MITLKIAAAAAAIAALPGLAAAATINDDGTTVISGADVAKTYFFTVGTDGSNGDWRHTFDLAGAGKGLAAVSLTPRAADAFSELTFSWWDINDASDDSDDVMLSWASIGAGVTELPTYFADPETLIQQLRISWTASPGNGFDGDVTIETAPVPVPAAGLLLLGGLGALGAIKRRKA